MTGLLRDVPNHASLLQVLMGAGCQALPVQPAVRRRMHPLSGLLLSDLIQVATVVSTQALAH